MHPERIYGQIVLEVDVGHGYLCRIKKVTLGRSSGETFCILAWYHILRVFKGADGLIWIYKWVISWKHDVLEIGDRGVREQVASLALAKQR